MTQSAAFHEDNDLGFAEVWITLINVLEINVGSSQIFKSTDQLKICIFKKNNLCEYGYGFELYGKLTPFRAENDFKRQTLTSERIKIV